MNIQVILSETPRSEASWRLNKREASLHSDGHFEKIGIGAQSGRGEPGARDFCLDGSGP
jgi:hypothetical protein